MNKKRGKTKWELFCDYVYSNLKKSLRELVNIKIYLIISLALFILSSLIGFLFPIFFEEQIQKLIQKLVNDNKDLGLFGLIRFIIVNNLQTSFFSVIFGVVFGIFPLAVSIINGYVLGFVANLAIQSEGFLILWRLLPHGLFEIPAVIISVALGIQIGFLLMRNCIIRYNKNLLNTIVLIFLSILLLPISFLICIILTISNKKLRKLFLTNLSSSIRTFVLVVIPLLVIAGIIEGIFIWLLG